ncbi:MAG: hypothetical protein K0S99_1325, partial [Thermomicrobiales bacterium]|nr:hypothetical protein [Thermomicrobiales bacterium]
MGRREHTLNAKIPSPSALGRVPSGWRVGGEGRHPGPVIVKMLLFPAPQKFNTFNTFNTFT